MADRLLLVTSPLLHGADVLARAAAARRARVRPGPARRGVRPGDGAGGAGVPGGGGDRAPTASSGRDPRGARRGAAGSRRRRSAVGRRALAEARRWIGTTEDPPGSNRTPFGVWFGLDGVPWCNIFVSYCFAVGAGYTIAAGFHGAGCTAARLRLRPDHRGLAARDRHVARPRRAAARATSRSTTGTAARPTTSASSSARARRGLHRDRGQHVGRNESDGGEVMRRDAHTRRRRRLRPRSQSPERPANPTFSEHAPSIDRWSRIREERGGRGEETPDALVDTARAQGSRGTGDGSAASRSRRCWRSPWPEADRGARRVAAAKATAFTGYAFDACNAPKIDSLAAWLASPVPRARHLHRRRRTAPARTTSSRPTGRRRPSRPAGA